MPNTTLAFLDTKHALDLARLDQACAAFFEACDAAGRGPSEEEQETLLRSFQSILAWRSEISRRPETSTARSTLPRRSQRSAR